MHIRKGRGKQATSTGKDVSVEAYSCSDLITLNHFYYCFLIALKLENTDKSSSPSSGKKKFMIRWLRTARAESLFAALVQPEIDWLLSQVLYKGMTADIIENNISRIYYGSLKMLHKEELPEYVSAA